MADIAINPVTRRVQFTGNTGTGPFAFTFNILADADIEVYKNTTLLTLTTDYTVTTNANGTGSITLVAGQALISSDYLTIVGGRDLERTTDFVTGGDLLASSLNEQLDSNVIMSQQLDERFGRSISVSPGDVDVSLELPTASTRANQILSFTSTGAVTATSLDGLPEITLDKLNVDNITLDGNTISTTDTNGNLTLAPNGTGDVIVSGDLIVNGATTTISSTELDITDKNITIASGSADSSAADGAGLTVDGPDATFNYKHDLLGWQLNKPITIGNTTTDYGGALNIYAKPLAGHVQTASIVIYADSLSYDPLIQFNTQSSDVFTMGIDSSDSRMFKIANSSAIGSSPVFTITDNGEISLGTNQPQSGYRFTISGASGAQANIAFKQSTHDNAIVNSSTNQMKFIGDINEDNTDTFSFKWLQRAQEKMILEGGTLKVDTINELTSAAGVTISTGVDITGTLTSDGLGIGTSSPSDDLHIASSLATIRLEDSDVAGGASYSLITSSSNGNITFSADPDNVRSSTDIRFSVDGSEAMRIDDSGNVGIGVADPDSALEVQSSASNLNSVHLSNTSSTGYGAKFIGGGNTSTRYIADFRDYSGASKVKIDGDGNVGIGTSSPDNKITIGDSSSIVVGKQWGLDFQDTLKGEPQAFIYAEGRYSANYNTDLIFGTIGTSGSAAERMRIDSSGNVGIGTTSPSAQLHIAGTGGSQPAYLYLERVDSAVNSGNEIGGIHFYAGESSATKVGGVRTLAAEAFTSTSSPTNMIFETTSSGNTSATERMRIDSSGNLLVGKTSADGITTAGHQFNSTGYTAHVRNNGVVSQFNRQTSDGDIVQFYKDTTTVGSIGTEGGDVTIGKAGSGLQFRSADPCVRPHNMTTNSPSDATVNLGRVNTRFKDLYLSGTVYFGPDGSGSITNGEGGYLFSNGQVYVSTNSSSGHFFNRVGTTNGAGPVMNYRYNGSTVGKIQVDSYYMDIFAVGVNNCGWAFRDNSAVLPIKNGTLTDNLVDLGSSSYRMDDIYATNGTIQTSDQNEKQQIAPLTDAEITAAKAISKLFKTFKWNDAVTEKGDAARTHSGVIAQEVEQAMTDAGLNAGDYAFFISTTWWETQTEVPAVEAVEAAEATYDEDNNMLTEAREAVEGREAYTRIDTYSTPEEAPEGATERNRKGIRYPQLLSFVAAATEQRLASIESRLDALEA